MSGRKLTILAILFLYFLTVLSLSAQDIAAQQNRKFILYPFANITQNSDYDYLGIQIFHVLKLNLEKYNNLSVFVPDDDLQLKTADFSIMDLCAYYNEISDAEDLILGEYYEHDMVLHVLVNIIDMESLRVKNSFSESMPADLEMLRNIENMSVRISDILASELPLLEREALLKKQLIERLRKDLDRKEALTQRIFEYKNIILVSPGSGLNLGRTIVSWTPEGPMIAPSFGIEYSRLVSSHFHIRGGVEYLPDNLLNLGIDQKEASVELLAGYHSESLNSFYFSMGVAFIYDKNQRSAALATGTIDSPVFPSIERFSLSIPIQTGLTLSMGSRYILDVRFKYNGLTWTIEQNGPSFYPEGERTYLYYYGLSVWNLLSMSLIAQLGVRF